MGELEKNLYREKEAVKKKILLLEKELRKLNYVEKKENEIAKVKIRGDSFEFYSRMNGRLNKECEKYVSIKEQDYIINLVKMEYYSKLKKTLEKRYNVIDRSINGLNRANPYKIYENIGKGKQKLILISEQQGKPNSKEQKSKDNIMKYQSPIMLVELSNERYRCLWESVKYKGKDFDENATEIYTEKGERVRSKSEKIIADKLFKENISYRYEYPLELSNGKIIYPDFTILDECRRRNVILEHFGLMDNEDYMNNALSKIKLYAKEGYIWGDNLFFTMETINNPLDSRTLDGIIKLLC